MIERALRRLGGALLLYSVCALSGWSVRWLLANSASPPSDRTGSPGDGGLSCASCHGGVAGSASNITLGGLPAAYTPGASYPLTFSVAVGGAQTRPGFEITAERAGPAAAVGSWTPGANTTTVGDSLAHSAANTGVTSWSFTWNAPATGQGTVTFYAAANASNNDGGTGGDRIDLRSVAVPQAVAPAISGLSPAFGSVNAQVTISGSGFGAAVSTVNFSGGASTAPALSWADASIVVLATGAASGGVTVTNSNGVSNAAVFTLITAAPSLSSATPGFGDRDAGSVTVGLSGANFSPGAAVSLSTTTPGLPVSSAAATGVAVATTTQATGLTFNLSGMATGFWTVNLSNPDAKGATLVDGFLVQVPPPRPVNAAVQVLSSTTLRWTWTVVGGNADGVRLVTSTGGAVSPDLGPGVSQYDEAVFGANELATRGVRAFNVAGSSTSLLVTTATLAGAPLSAATTFPAVAAAGLSAAWGAGPNPPGTRYDAVLSTSTPLSLGQAANVTVSTQPQGAPQADFTGLSIDTTYYLFVAAVSRSGAATAYTALGSTVTLAQAPAGAGTPFSSVGSGGFSAAWDANGNPAGLRYEALVSTSADPAPSDGSAVSVSTRPEGAPGAPFAGLIPNTTYFLAVRAFNRLATPTGFIAAGSTVTRANEPTTEASTFSALGAGSVTAAWNRNANPFGTLYRAVLSTATPLVATHSGNVTVSTAPQGPPSAAFGGLASDTTYFLFVAAVDHGGQASAFTALGSTATHPNAPVSAASTFSAPAPSSMTVSWGANGNPAGTRYDAVVSTAAPLVETHSGNVAVSTRPSGSPSAGFAGLAPNTTYFAFARAFGHGGTATAYAALGATVTQAAAPVSAASTFSLVGTAGLTGSWDAAGNPPGTLYEAVAATAAPLTPGLGGNVTVSTRPQGAPSAAFAGLAANTTYYLFARALSHAGLPSAWAALGSTATRPAAPSGTAPTAVSSFSVSLAWSLNGNAPDTLFEVSTSSVDAFVTGSAIAAAPAAAGGAATLGGLAAFTTHYFRVRALGRDGSGGPFDAVVSTRTLPPLPLAPGTPAGTLLGTSSLSWTWGAAVAATGYEVFSASSGVLLAAPAANAFVQLGLSVNAAAGIVVRGTNAQGAGPLSAPATAFTAAAPAASLAVGGVTPDSVALGWDAASNPAGTRWEVSASSDGFVLSFSTPVPLSAALTASSASVGGLSLATTYHFRVRPYNGDGIPAAFSAVVSTATPAFPDAPSGFAGTALSTGDILWSWTDSSSNETGFQVFASSGGAVSPDLPPGAVSWLQAGLAAGASVQNFVVALGSAGAASAPSAAGRRFTLARPPSGTTVSVPAGTSTALRVEWSSGGASGYALERSTFAAGGYAETASSATLAASATSYLDAGLTAKTTYFYRLRAFNGDGLATVYDSTVSARTNPPPPAAPALSGSAVSTGAVQWSWDAQADVTGYGLKTSSGGPIVYLDGSATSYLETGLSAGTTVSRFLKALNGAGEALSSTLTVATAESLAAVPSASSTTFNLGTTAVVFPAGALGAAGSALGSADPAARPLVPSTPADLARANAALGGLQVLTGSVRQFLAFEGGVRKTGDFGAPVTVTIPYPDADGDGTVDGTALKADALALYTLQEGGGTWTRLGGAVDRAARTVSAPAAHFSLFALIGPAAGTDLDAVRIFPNPLRPSRGHTAVNFQNLPALSRLRLYTVAGERVAGLDADASGQAAWDGRNSAGRPVASGVYLLVIEGAGAKRIFKVAVQR